MGYTSSSEYLISFLFISLLRKIVTQKSGIATLIYNDSLQQENRKRQFKKFT